MYINRDGIEVKNECAYVSRTAEVKNKYMVRLIKKEFGKSKVEGEELYSEYPTVGNLKFCLGKYPGTFAVIQEIYELEDNELPFQ